MNTNERLEATFGTRERVTYVTPVVAFDEEGRALVAENTSSHKATGRDTLVPVTRYANFLGLRCERELAPGRVVSAISGDGWYVVADGDPDEEDKLAARPIAAWLVYENGDLSPVTWDGDAQETVNLACREDTIVLRYGEELRVDRESLFGWCDEPEAER